MADGKGCTCAAHSESECGCDADWTPQEVYDLRAENDRLKTAIRRLAEQDATLSVIGGNIILDVDAKLTDAEREAIELCAVAASDPSGFRPAIYQGDQIAATLRGLLERTNDPTAVR
jgi:hypothetical protein